MPRVGARLPLGGGKKQGRAVTGPCFLLCLITLVLVFQQVLDDPLFIPPWGVSFLHVVTFSSFLH